ncbi:hypothetical protein [Rhodococcus sp. NPDC127528]|uniref:LppU family putative lipoprotein n=1 Tax=unclassified Rhodococcus (in: high G+C Gram-positive bacteria) TaxID=192944 RepID=UPI003634839A
MNTVVKRGSWVRGAVLAAGLTTLALGVTACSPKPTTVTGSPVAATTTIAGQQAGDGGGSTDFRAEIGDCVTLGGTTAAAEISKAACGSAESNYKVVAKAKANSNCPSDADQVYYETLGSREQGALCLDIDWIVGGCMSVPAGDDEPLRVECGDPSATAVERAVQIIEDTTDIEQCSEGGFTHPERRFTVCTESVTE